MQQSFREFVKPGFIGNTGLASLSGYYLPTPTLDIPTKIIEGRVRRISYTTNPILITLENGMNWSVTKKQWDYLVSIDRQPKENRRMQIEVCLDGTIKSVSVI